MAAASRSPQARLAVCLVSQFYGVHSGHLKVRTIVLISFNLEYDGVEFEETCRHGLHSRTGNHDEVRRNRKWGKIGDDSNYQIQLLPFTFTRKSCLARRFQFSRKMMDDG